MMKKLLQKKLSYPLFLIFALFFQTFAAANSVEQKICLSMIVKNESSIIERCLNSVKGIVDCISICDTGSEDDTVNIIESFLQQNNIPGKVHQHEWKNFGHNRSLSAKAAQETLQELEFPLGQTLLLLLDADMLLKIDPSFDKNALKSDEYLLLQTLGNITYYNTRLIRASLPWECIGVTHEYWGCRFPHSCEKFELLSIDDRGDGGSKTDKFERDIKLLLQGLQDEPNNVRYMFYLAQSYKCLNQYADAIRWYKERIERGGWHEEVWYSRFMIGECYEAMGFWDQAMRWYLEAYEDNADRAETLQKIATHYRLKGKNHLAYQFAKIGTKIPYPAHQYLFISNDVYNYRFDEELSIAAYYTSFKEEGYAAANRLLLKKEVPDYLKEATHQNTLFYVQNIKNAHFEPIKVDLPSIKEGMEITYNATNPSIQRTEEGFTLICRAVNWVQSGGKDYRSLDPDGIFRTKNYLLRYDKKLQLLSQKEIVEATPRQKFSSHVDGLEDCRLIKMQNDNYWFTCTTYDSVPGSVTQTLCKIEEQEQIANVEKFIPLKGENPSCEKNWLPFCLNNEIYVIYYYNPFTIYKIDSEKGECETVLKYNPVYDFSKFRGSAPPIEFDDGYLVLVHEVVFKDCRHYLHRFLYLDKNFQVQSISKPFTFQHVGIEYCCGMALDHDAKHCILTIGIEDREAYFCTVDIETIHSMLEKV